MEKAVVDTSIVVKWFIEEEKTNEAQRLLELYKDGKIMLHIPDIVILELINALYWNGLSEKQITRAIEFLYDLEIKFIVLSKSLALLTGKIVHKYKTASYDSLFILVAKQLNCKLFTADRKHHTKAIYKKIHYL